MGRVKELVIPDEETGEIEDPSIWNKLCEGEGNASASC